ncbi:hypothetical protein C1903_02895 [Listeria ivanovii]|uniref:hypothetical protein n=1 Tax=Listeria ivanovii TaxID=1638 RepID=UPI000DA761C6|nr:hypothetical protein [Listeria ivanovii]PZF90516.1 hypothetical protein C1905_02965 [Listeria ivanovii]PZF95902.1 hypothetical protein C1903_02895 [Listeria ivanovii]PZG06152.1 hypothetical protein C2L88_02890 [Listeria ivanovii]PZG11065.1 hypothetical protein C1901_03235 [Listeria ivanovii]PZG28040.1 hypothetical protein C1900_02970 [Listeria ivanovii]
MSITWNKILLFIGVSFYVYGLKASYVYFISPAFSYFGSINLHPSMNEQLVSLLFVFVPLLWSNTHAYRPSRIVYWILYMMVYVPAMLVPDYVRINNFDEILLLKSVLLFCLILIYITADFKLIPVYYIKVKKQVVLLFVTIFSFSLWGIIVQTFGIHFNFSKVDDVYDLREAYRDQVNRFSGYAINWQSKIVNALFLALGFVSKNKWLICIGVLGQLFIFSITGQKSIALSSIFILGIIFCLRNNGRHFVLYFVYGVTALVFLAMGLDVLTESAEYTSLFVRRMLITPGLLLSYYFDFFSVNPKVYLSHSILSPFMSYPYDKLPPFLIGEHYFGRVDLAANANIWADGFANFGYAGIISFSVLLMGILYLYDSLSEHRNFIVSAILMAMPAWSLVDTSLITSILTHGILLAFIINYFLATERKGDPLYEENHRFKFRSPLE